MLLLASSGAFIAGVFLGDRFDIAAPALGVFTAASVLLIVLLRGTGRPSLPAWLALLLVLGAMRVTLFEGDMSGLAVHHAGGALEIQGMVVGDPSATKVGTRVRFVVDRGVYLAALALGRPRSIFPALGFATALMVALDPDALWSVSFQLSFAAMAGIAIIAPPLAQLIQRLYDDRLVRGAQLVPVLNGISFVVSMTVGATIATVPLVAFYFEWVSLVAGAYVDTGTVAPLLVGTYYALLIVWWTGALHWRTAYDWVRQVVGTGPSVPLRDRTVPVWVLAPVVSAAALLWTAAITLPDGRL